MDTFAVSDTSVNMRHPWIAEAKKYIHHSQERTNMHSRLLNVVKNHGQVVNLLKSWSRTRVYRQWWWASEFVISFHTEIDVEPTRNNVHPSSYASRSYSGVKGALIEKALKVPLCSSYGEQSYTHFFLYYYFVKNSKRDVSKGLDRKATTLKNGSGNNDSLHLQVAVQTYIRCPHCCRVICGQQGWKHDFCTELMITCKWD